MSAPAHGCPSCATPLPEDAAFCYKCGTATPHHIDRETGQITTAPGATDDGQHARLQEALGETYEVRRLLGRGGFAEVYVAYDKRLKREIAVKTLRGDVVASPSLLERFQREAEAVAKLRHSNVVPIYSVGEEGGLAYYTMPLIEGDSLAAVLDREGRLPVAEACRILREAAYGLHAAHRAGIVHRDIKPENIMLEGPERSVVVMDFGIAKTGGPEEKGLTGTGMLIGTPQYMSPEQAMGERALDHRSDQYSLAMVGYRMLTGRLPFEGDAVQTQIFKAVTEVPPRLVDVTPDVPTPVSDAIARALAKHPEDRFDSMQSFAAALELVHAAPGSSVVRRRLDLATRVARMRSGMPSVRRPETWLTLALLVVLVVLTRLTTPRAVVSLADNRDDALFAARAFLNTRTTAAARPAYATLDRYDRAFAFLFRQLPFDSAQRRAERDIPVWDWTVKFPGRNSRDHWQVWVGVGNRITGYRHVIPDTAALATLPIDSARALAEREVVARGWPLARLVRLPDSTIVRKARTDYRFRWRVRDGAIAWRGADSAHVRVAATVIGGQVEWLAEQLFVPESFKTGESSPVLGLVVVLVGIALIGAAIGLAIKRQRTDELQWGTMTRLVGAAAVALLVAQIPSIVEGLATLALSEQSGGGGYVQQVLNVVLVGVICIGPILCAAAVGESLAQEVRSGVMAGVEDLSRGRLAIPEMVPAAARGYLVGVAIALGAVLTTLVSLRFHVGGAKAPATEFSGVPVVSQLASPATWALALLLLMFVIAVLARVRALERVAMFLPAVFTLAVVGLASDSAMTAAEAFLTVLLLCYALWHHDLLTALVATLVSAFIQTALTFLQSSNGRYVTGGVVMLALFLAPALVAIVAYRRAVRAAAEQAARSSGSRVTPLPAA